MMKVRKHSLPTAPVAIHSSKLLFFLQRGGMLLHHVLANQTALWRKSCSCCRLRLWTYKRHTAIKSRPTVLDKQIITRNQAKALFPLSSAPLAVCTVAARSSPLMRNGCVVLNTAAAARLVCSSKLIHRLHTLCCAVAYRLIWQHLKSYIFDKEEH